MTRRLLFTMAALAWFFLLTKAPAESAVVYTENEWNFVDASIDPSQGIPEDAEGTLGRIRDRGLLRVATEPYFPPQEFIDPSLPGQARYVGSDMELARRIAERMGVEVEIVPMDFSRVLIAVADDECDLAISGLAYTPARASSMTLSKGYHYAGEGGGSGLLIRLSDEERIRTLADLADLDIAVQAGSLQEAMAAENIQNYRQFRRLSSVSRVHQAVQDGTVDAGIVDVENALTFMESNPDCGLAVVEGIRFAPEAQFNGDRVAAKKGEVQLICFVNGVIDELLVSGEYQRWFDECAGYAVDLGL